MVFGSFRRHMLLTQAVNLARESTKRRAAAGTVGAAAFPDKLVRLESMGGKSAGASGLVPRGNANGDPM